MHNGASPPSTTVLGLATNPAPVRAVRDYGFDRRWVASTVACTIFGSVYGVCESRVCREGEGIREEEGCCGDDARVRVAPFRQRAEAGRDHWQGRAAWGTPLLRRTLRKLLLISD